MLKEREEINISRFLYYVTLQFAFQYFVIWLALCTVDLIFVGWLIIGGFLVAGATMLAAAPRIPCAMHARGAWNRDNVGIASMVLFAGAFLIQIVLQLPHANPYAIGSLFSRILLCAPFGLFRGTLQSHEILLHVLSGILCAFSSVGYYIEDMFERENPYDCVNDQN